MTSTCLNNILAEVYSAMICRIYTLLYGIKLGTKLAKEFYCRQSRICRDNVGKAKCLPFSQVKTLPIRSFKEKLHIGAKLVKSRGVTAIGIKICLSLTG